MTIGRTVVGVDTAKRVFQLHWVDLETGEIVDLKLTRARFLEHFANRVPCLIAMEACGGSQHWARRLDNIFIERLWRSLKYEAVYLHEIADGFQARRLIGEWVRFYNLERPHAALDGRTPAEAYRGDPPVDMMDKPLRALPTSPQAQQQQKEDRSKGILAA